MDHAPEISHLAAAALRDALAAAQRGDIPAALGALMSIDAASWTGIKARLADLGGVLPVRIGDSKTHTSIYMGEQQDD